MAIIWLNSILTHCTVIYYNYTAIKQLQIIQKIFQMCREIVSFKYLSKRFILMTFELTGLSKISINLSVGFFPFFGRTIKYKIPMSGTNLKQQFIEHLKSAIIIQMYLRNFSINTLPRNPVPPVMKIFLPLNDCIIRSSSIESVIVLKNIQKKNGFL